MEANTHAVSTYKPDWEAPLLKIGLFTPADLPVRKPLITPPSQVPVRGVRTSPTSSAWSSNASEFMVEHTR